MDKIPPIVIEVEPRRWTIMGRLPLVLVHDLEEGWVRVYGDWGWQRFPVYWIKENTEPVDEREAGWILRELEAKGYKYEVTIVLKGDQDERMETIFD